MTVITRDDYKLGHNITITCNQGYQAVGITEVMCSNDSTWIPALPSCVLGIVCLLLKVYITDPLYVILSSSPMQVHIILYMNQIFRLYQNFTKAVHLVFSESTLCLISSGQPFYWHTII